MTLVFYTDLTGGDRELSKALGVSGVTSCDKCGMAAAVLFLLPTDDEKSTR